MERDIIEKIRNCGALGYSLERTKKIIDTNASDNDIEMELSKGRAIADYVLELKVFEMAQSGDLKALHKLQSIRENRDREQ